MTVPRLSVDSTPARDSTAAIVLVGASVPGSGPDAGSPRLWAAPGFEHVARQLAAIGFRGGSDEMVRLPPDPARAGAPAVAVIGLPHRTSGSHSPDELRLAAGSATRQLTGVDSLAIALPVQSAEQLGAVLEGAALGAYTFDGLRSQPQSAASRRVSSVAVHAEVPGPGGQGADDLVARALAAAQAVSLVKDLVNAPPSHLYPQTLAEAAEKHAAGLPVQVTVWDEERLAQDGFGGILGVGQGSARGPRLVKVAYAPVGDAGETARHLALVGKGITFDTGGISLKPPVPMVGMKYDMTGAATVLAVVLAAARLGLPVRLTAWLCIAENMPSGSAMRPNDVLHIHGGRTVEVLNTDAEGRLVMADGLAAASEEHPDAIVDVATLTGAAMVALGTRYAAVMGDDGLVDRVRQAASATGELLWPMPLPEELRATLNSDVADIANANPGNTAGGMLLAGVFLQEFVGTTSDDESAPRIPWAHLDIAGPAKGAGGPYGFTGKGPTGVSVRALLRLAEDFSRLE